MLLQKIKEWFTKFLSRPSRSSRDDSAFSADHRQFLSKEVEFYQQLSELEQKDFRQRVLLFLETTEIVGNGVQVSDEDRLLVAASAIIPVWSFKNWHYINLHTVILVPAAFNQEAQIGQSDSNALGMVGTGVFAGKMILSQPALHAGFKNSRDKKNVGIHEFAHLIDMADGKGDGFPEKLKDHSYSVPWFQFIEGKIQEIQQNKSNIDRYGATNTTEFFAVASEYFFERPDMMKKKHPQLYNDLSSFYQRDVADIQQDIKIRRKAPCPCGSGKNYKRCCYLPVEY